MKRKDFHFLILSFCLAVKFLEETLMRRRAAYQLSRKSRGGALGIPEYMPPIRRQDIQGKMVSGSVG